MGRSKNFNKNDIIGHEFGDLKVLWWSHYNGYKHFYSCLCRCGKIHAVSRSNLISGATKSCHCFHADNDEELKEIIMRIPPTRKGCRIWKGSSNTGGYGVVSYKGKASARVHVESARIFHGPRPDGLVTMHSCACKRCVEPSHLSYGTHSQNHRDAYKNEGRAKKGEAMNLEKARQARAMHSHMSYRAIAKRMGCSPNFIGNIIRGENWKEPLTVSPEDDWSSEGHCQMDFNF